MQLNCGLQQKKELYATDLCNGNLETQFKQAGATD